MNARRVKRWLRAIAAVTVPAVACALVAMATAPAAQAAELKPDLKVTMTAARHILPVDGWTKVSTTVRNVGNAPASNVRLVITLPPELHDAEQTTGGEWNCASPPSWPLVLTCDYIGDFAVGAVPYPIDLTMSPYQATAGQTLSPHAEVTTSSPDRNLANNSSTKPISIVAKSIINGQVWNDLNANGIREPGEPAINSVGVSFWSVDDEDLYGQSNTFDGTFRFDVPTKRYYAETQVIRSKWRFTKENVGSDATDSDVRQTSVDDYFRNARSATFVAPANGTVTIDIGLVAVAPAS